MGQLRRADNRHICSGIDSVVHSPVRNITVTIDDEVYRRARIKAAENLTSVSAVVRKFLEEYAEKESERERLLRLERETFEQMSKRGSAFNASKRLTRQEANSR